MGNKAGAVLVVVLLVALVVGFVVYLSRRRTAVAVRPTAKPSGGNVAWNLAGAGLAAALTGIAQGTSRSSGGAWAVGPGYGTDKFMGKPSWDFGDRSSPTTNLTLREPGWGDLVPGAGSDPFGRDSGLTAGAPQPLLAQAEAFAVEGAPLKLSSGFDF